MITFRLNQDQKNFGARSGFGSVADTDEPYLFTARGAIAYRPKVWIILAEGSALGKMSDK